MDGFRKQLSADVKELRDLVGDVIRGNYVENDDLQDAMNEVITKSNVLNCVYDPEDKSFNDISHIEIEHLETESNGAS